MTAVFEWLFWFALFRFALFSLWKFGFCFFFLFLANHLLLSIDLPRVISMMKSSTILWKRWLLKWHLIRARFTIVIIVELMRALHIWMKWWWTESGICSNLTALFTIDQWRWTKLWHRDTFNGVEIAHSKWHFNWEISSQFAVNHSIGVVAVTTAITAL